MSRGKEIEKRILDEVKRSKRPLSTHDLAKKIDVSWHPVMNHCLRLQMAGKIDGYKFGNINAWVIKK